ncbi:MAG: PHP domain-containing protein [Anaerolineales bacterium]|nr:PHP domain-containing protein [Anaerolineales bacterium]
MTPGLKFCAGDLHVHTPASKCFRGTVTPEAYVAQAIDAGMRAIAITDHNTGDWIDRIKSAAAGTTLTVFPGVEISVAPGVHILAIFPEDRGTAHVTDLLARLGVRADARGEQEALVTEHGVQRVISIIRSENARRYWLTSTITKVRGGSCVTQDRPWCSSGTPQSSPPSK